MCEKTKDKEKKIEESSKPKDEESKNYYYDDAHGYQKYDPDSDEDEFED